MRGEKFLWVVVNTQSQVEKVSKGRDERKPIMGVKIELVCKMYIDCLLMFS